MCLGALDTLGAALSQHNHPWTSGERAIFEDAAGCLRHALGLPSLPDDDDEGADAWKQG